MITPTKHYFRIKEQVEHLVFNEDILLIEIHTILQEAMKMISEALESIEEKLDNERSSNSDKGT